MILVKRGRKPDQRTLTAVFAKQIGYEMILVKRGRKRHGVKLRLVDQLDLGRYEMILVALVIVGTFARL